MNCEMCGKSTDDLYNTKIEGVVLKVCRQCSSYGVVVSRVREVKEGKYNRSRVIRRAQPKRNEAVEQIVSNYNVLVKNARESMGLKQEELAKKINEKESLIHHIETKKKEPSIPLAKKLEKFLNIKLIEVVEGDVLPELLPKKRSGPLTIGDVIKIRKR